MSELGQWQQLDPRMTVVLPLQELKRWIGPVIALLVAGSATGGTWQFYALLLPVAVGITKYATTRYRVSEERVELQRGLVNRRHISTPLDRVRTVDLTASPVHRLLGLTTVRIGTGSSGASDAGFDLDALPVIRARALRDDLLHRVARAGGEPDRPLAPDAPPSQRVAARFEPGWLRYAPFTAGGLAILGAGLAALTQTGDALVPLRRRAFDLIGLGQLRESLWAFAVAGLLAGVVLMVLLSVAAYAAAYGRLVLAFAEPDGPWQLRRGLLTTRETSIDTARLAGVTLSDPLPLRWAGGARLSAIVTGLKRGEAGASLLVPPTSRTVVEHAAGAVVGTDAPVSGPLQPHGRAAVTRRYTRALLPTALVALASAGGAVLAERWWVLAVPPVLLAAAAYLALDRSRALGHALAGRFLVARAGSLLRRRDVLATDHVIGWTSRSTWFQRRAGLVTLRATTAGGRGYVEVLDVPESAAVDLARTASPGLLDPFLTPRRAATSCCSPDRPSPGVP